MNAPARPAARREGADTREKLLQTALRLYAEEGLNAVSLRRISSATGCKNSAAVHYHFRNKLGVLQALVERITAEIESLHQRQETQPKTLHSACRECLLPIIQLANSTPWGGNALRFLSRLVSEGDADIKTLVNTLYAPRFQRLDDALAQVLPDLPTEVRRLRLLFISTNVIHGVADADWLQHSPLGDFSHLDEQTQLDHLIDYLLGGLTAGTSQFQTNTNDETRL